MQVTSLSTTNMLRLLGVDTPAHIAKQETSAERIAVGSGTVSALSPAQRAAAMVIGTALMNISRAPSPALVVETSTIEAAVLTLSSDDDAVGAAFLKETKTQIVLEEAPRPVIARAAAFIDKGGPLSALEGRTDAETAMALGAAFLSLMDELAAKGALPGVNGRFTVDMSRVGVVTYGDAGTGVVGGVVSYRA